MTDRRVLDAIEASVRVSDPNADPGMAVHERRRDEWCAEALQHARQVDTSTEAGHRLCRALLRGVFDAHRLVAALRRVRKDRQEIMEAVDAMRSVHDG